MNDSSTEILDGSADCVRAIRHLLNQAVTQVAIFSQNLEPQLYNHQQVFEQLAQLARKDKYSQVRIIAQQTRNAVADGHALVRLAQRLPSYVTIRTPTTPELQRFEQSWLIIDDHSICELTNPQRWEGKLIQFDRKYVRDQLQFFNDAWEHSQPDSNSRRLGI